MRLRGNRSQGPWRGRHAKLTCNAGQNSVTAKHAQLLEVSGHAKAGRQAGVLTVGAPAAKVFGLGGRAGEGHQLAGNNPVEVTILHLQRKRRLERLGWGRWGSHIEGKKHAAALG